MISASSFLSSRYHQTSSPEPQRLRLSRWNPKCGKKQSFDGSAWL